MDYTATEILESSNHDFWNASTKQVDRILEEHGMERGEGVDQYGNDRYNGPHNLQDLAKWLGY
jgi:hypothetical protein